jgi:hypothetical protein
MTLQDLLQEAQKLELGDQIQLVEALKGWIASQMSIPGYFPVKFSSLALESSDLAPDGTLAAGDFQFWEGVDLEQIRPASGLLTIEAIEANRAEFWPEEESIEDFLEFLYAQRELTRV